MATAYDILFGQADLKIDGADAGFGNPIARLRSRMRRNRQARQARNVVSAIFLRDEHYLMPGLDGTTTSVAVEVDAHGPTIVLTLESGLEVTITSYDHNEEWPTYCVSWETQTGILCTEELRLFMLVSITRAHSPLVHTLKQSEPVARFTTSSRKPIP